MILTKDFTDKVAETGGYTKKDVAEIWETMKDVLIDYLADGETVKLVRFGVFDVKDVAEKVVNNSVVKNATLPAKKVVRFKISDTLKTGLQ